MKHISYYLLKKIFVVLIFLACTMNVSQLRAQSDSLFVIPDTCKIFTIDNFYFLVLQHHPIAKQAYLLSDVAKQEIRLARGNFDPKLELQYQQKNFGETEYFDLLDASLEFPSTLPFDPKVGVERNQGSYLNPENYISDAFSYRQFYAGINLPLGKGLFTDERRTALKQAELFQQMTEAEQVKILNKLLLEAAKEYWQWYFMYYNYRILNRGVRIASEIFSRVKVNATLGEAASIDTVQAKITLQERKLQQQEALLNFQNAGLSISNYLWDSTARPLTLPLNWIPVRPTETFSLSQGELLELREQALTNHPELQKIDIKIQQLETDRKLAVEFLKPKLDVSYVFLNQPFDPAWNSEFSIGDNYKLGVDFSFPLFLRKERAKLIQTKLKLSATRFDQQLNQKMIANQIDAAYNTLKINAGNILQLQQMVSNYERILEAEFLNLENGESDLFKVNIQQEKLIAAQSKYLKVISEYEKNKAELYWAAGVRNLGID